MLDRAIFMRRFYDEVYNHQNVDFLRQHFHPDVLGHGPGVADVIEGIETVMAFSQYVYEVYADYHLEVDNVVADGDQVVVRERSQIVIYQPARRLAPSPISARIW